MRTLSTVAILALAFTGANAAIYTGDGAVPNEGSVQVGTAGACPVRVPARRHMSPRSPRSLRERVGHDAPRARARSAQVASARVRPRRILCDRRAPPRSRVAAADLPSPPPSRRVADRVHLRRQLHRRLLLRFPAGETVDIKLCFTDEKIKERPWRKYVNNLEKNKQCWQTADMLKILKKDATTTAADGSGSVSVELPVTSPPPNTPSVYSKDVTAPSAVAGLQEQPRLLRDQDQDLQQHAHLPRRRAGVLHRVSILVLVGSYTYDRAKRALA